MPQLRIRLFGKLTVDADRMAGQWVANCKAQELLAHLLLFRNRPHHREVLADLLWGNQPTHQSRKYLRKSLWQLQSFLDSMPPTTERPVLLVDPNWIQINPQADLWLDTAAFEAAFAGALGEAGPNLSPESFDALAAAARLYTGELLQGFYQNWCLLERERYREMYLALMDKLMGYCESHQLFEAGLEYGQAILRQDRAREVTHRRLMRLLYLSGDRTSALRQYEACRRALEEDLHVAPDATTLWLVRRIVRQQPSDGVPDEERVDPVESQTLEWQESLQRVKGLLEIEASVQQRLPIELRALEAALRDITHPH